MMLSIVIPVRPPEEGKSRLAPVLNVRARAELVERMFCHVLRTAVSAVTSAGCHVISHSPVLLDIAAASGARTIRESGRELNAALTQAAESVRLPGPILALSADIPLLEVADITAMTEALAYADVVAATDRAGSGTNALLLREPGLIPYLFGEGSLERHRLVAVARGLRFAVIQRRGLSTDIDVPADLSFLSMVVAAT
jgi:2-phospho-L-lactate guanylyltransferase